MTRPCEIDGSVRRRVFLEIGLISCTKAKKDEPAQPKNLYEPSSLYRKAREYCIKYHDDWFILSAKHGLLDPVGPEIEPYDQTLNTASKSERKMWSKNVLKQLKDRNLINETLYFHSGQKYYDQLLLLLDQLDVNYELPVKGLRIGNRLSWYNEKLEK